MRFLKGIQVFGRDWDNVAETVQTHTVSEVRAYAEKHDRRQQMSPGRKKKPCLQDFNLQTLRFVFVVIVRRLGFSSLFRHLMDFFLGRDIEDRLGTDDDFVWEPPSKVSRTH